ncbi:MAG: response regulator [SAR324 cluster bacterium]|nr:response regulator [SAR324 cluster bacterium]
MSDSHILIVEDEIKIMNVLHDYAENAGFRVSELNRGDRAVSFVKKTPPDLILLDLMLPGMDGIEICREIRKFSSVPIIMITAKGDEIDRLLGLELGADDYISKPFSPREVIARIKAVLRRTHQESKEKKISVEGIELDEDLHQVWIESQEIPLTPIQFGLLKTMLARPNRVFPRDELINQVQGYEFEGYDRSVDSHIKNLRKKIAAVIPGKEVISSVYGVGYKLNSPPKPSP